MATDKRRYPCPLCEAKSSVANYGTHTYCFACSKRTNLTSGSGAYYAGFDEDDDDGFRAHHLAEPMSVCLEPSDLHQEWVTKRGYGPYELDYLKSHGDFGTVKYSVAINIADKLQDAGGQWPAIHNWSDKIKKYEQSNYNLAICRDFNGDPSSFQYFIRGFDNKNLKLYGPHRRAKPSMVRFEGNTTGIIYAGEGLATCLGAFFLLNQKYTCVSFLDANNLIKNLPELMDQNPGSQIIIIGDDDYDPDNPDKANKGKEVAKTFKGRANSAFPLREWKQYDWDDVYRSVKKGNIDRELARETLTKAIKSPVDYGSYKVRGLQLSIEDARDHVSSFVKDKFTKADSRDYDEDNSAVVHMFDEDSDFGYDIDSIQRNKVSVIDSVPGIGKTTACIEEMIYMLQQGTERKFEILAHTHQKCEEIKTKVLSRMSETVGVTAGQVVHRRGMTEETCINPVMKKALAEEDKESKMNLIFCGKCPFNSSCPFMTSNRDAKKAQIMISTHAYARYKNRAELTYSEVPIVIIDEDPLSSLSMDPVFMDLVESDGRLPEHRAVFDDACYELSLLEDGHQVIDDIDEGLTAAKELSAKLYTLWENEYEQCIADSGGDAKKLFELLNKRKVKPNPPVKSGFWGRIAVSGVSILRMGDKVHIRTPPVFKRYTQYTDIIVTDAKADRNIYKAMFPNSDLHISEFVDVPIDDNASHFQIVETNYTNLKQEQQKVLAESVSKVMEGKNAVIISNKSVLKEVKADVSMNFTSALGTNGLEENELLIVMAWQRPPAFEMTLAAYNLFGDVAMDNEWTSATENVLGEEVNRGHYPSNDYVKSVYNQLVRKPVYHAINRLRPIIPNRHLRTTILISNQFVSDKLTRKDARELNIVHRLTDTAFIGKPEGYKSKTAWEFLIIQAVKERGELRFKTSAIADAIDVNVSAVNKVSMRKIRGWMEASDEVDVVEVQGSKKSRTITMLISKSGKLPVKDTSHVDSYEW